MSKVTAIITSGYCLAPNISLTAALDGSSRMKLWDYANIQHKERHTKWVSITNKTEMKKTSATDFE